MCNGAGTCGWRPGRVGRGPGSQDRGRVRPAGRPWGVMRAWGHVVHAGGARNVCGELTARAWSAACGAWRWRVHVCGAGRQCSWGQQGPVSVWLTHPWTSCSDCLRVSQTRHPALVPPNRACHLHVLHCELYLHTHQPTQGHTVLGTEFLRRCGK